jgi:hypothetical protein
METTKGDFVPDSGKCQQCGKPAIMAYGGNLLCVEHHLMMRQANYLQQSQLAAFANFFSEQIARGTGYLVPPNHIEIPRPPFVGDKLTLNHIDVSNSTVGAINTGTVQHLDAAVTVFGNQGQLEIATKIKEFTQALIDNSEINDLLRNEIAEQLAFLTAQMQAKPEERSKGIAKSILSGIGTSISGVASLLAIWEKLQPLIEKVLFAM